MNLPAPAAPSAVAVRPDIAAALHNALAASRAPATRRAYRTAWTAWADWADAHEASPIPADPSAVAAYLADRAQAGAGMATLRMACAAIAAAHDMMADAARDVLKAGKPVGFQNPCSHRLVREAMKGFARIAADNGKGAARQARGLTAEAVAAIRGAMNGKVEETERAARDMALVSVMADAGLRRSEAAALTWADIEAGADGSGRIAIRRSKTDQEGAGAVVAITADAMRDLERLASMRGSDPTASVFGLSDRQIARRLAAAARSGGLGDGFSGHSGRVGMAQRMTRNGAPAAAVMRQGRWQSVRMVASYTRSETAAEALRYL